MTFYFNSKSFRLYMLCGIVTAFIFTLYACGGEDNDPVAEEPEEEEKTCPKRQCLIRFRAMAACSR